MAKQNEGLREDDRLAMELPDSEGLVPAVSEEASPTVSDAVSSSGPRHVHARHGVAEASAAL